MRNESFVPADLLIAEKLLYEPQELFLTGITQEKESHDYDACTFLLNNKYVLFRSAKITPTKNGQFVTLWKRIGDSVIMPYDSADSIDFCIISVRKAERLGQFIFPKQILVDKGYISQDKKGGKRAMRVYPPWDNPESKQAEKTQKWQLQYFKIII